MLLDRIIFIIIGVEPLNYIRVGGRPVATLYILY
jgi:hypothetical protein